VSVDTEVHDLTAYGADRQLDTEAVAERARPRASGDDDRVGRDLGTIDDRGVRADIFDRARPDLDAELGRRDP
jgi:hypothetical protein